MGLAFLITSDGLSILGERKVLKEAEYSALLDASSLVKVAREEANRIVTRAVQQAEAARAKGYQDGVAQARAEQAAAMLSDAVRTERQLQGLREAMARLVARAVEQFVGEADRTALLAAALQKVDLLVREEPFITVLVSPQQEPTLRAALAQLSSQAQPWLATLRIVVDASLAEDACVLQTPSGTLSIGVGAQIEAFRAALARNGLGEEAAA